MRIVCLASISLWSLHTCTDSDVLSRPFFDGWRDAPASRNSLLYQDLPTLFSSCFRFALHHCIYATVRHSRSFCIPCHLFPCSFLTCAFCFWVALSIDWTSHCWAKLRRSRRSRLGATFHCNSLTIKGAHWGAPRPRFCQTSLLRTVLHLFDETLQCWRCCRSRRGVWRDLACKDLVIGGIAHSQKRQVTDHGTCFTCSVFMCILGRLTLGM